ncbi:hypothetical protein [Nonomuraea jabiensis]|uniref:hypothetical protein n=1 Tax=Nonomuraea jabiensis TaxID=882448 RepID=UPI003D7385A8
MAEAVQGCHVWQALRVVQVLVPRIGQIQRHQTRFSELAHPSSLCYRHDYEHNNP